MPSPLAHSPPNTNTSNNTTKHTSTSSLTTARYLGPNLESQLRSPRNGRYRRCFQPASTSSSLKKTSAQAFGLFIKARQTDQARKWRYLRTSLCHFVHRISSRDRSGSLQQPVPSADSVPVPSCPRASTLPFGAHLSVHNIGMSCRPAKPMEEHHTRKSR